MGFRDGAFDAAVCRFSFHHFTDPARVFAEMARVIGPQGWMVVVDVTALNDHTWFDRAGNFHSDELHVVERYTPISPYHMKYEATIEDPKVFTRPWKMSFPLYRRVEENAQLVEFNCVPFVEELMYGPLGLYKPPSK